ncbi:MAG: LuxR C-terminal-related transcriptional regulator [Gaiellaceae bacterium]
MHRTKILVAESLAIFRTGVRNLLRRESDLDVLEASTFAEVSDVIAAGCPDIALIDLELPPLGGVEAVRLLADSCSTHLIVWSFDPTREAVLAAVRAGADGYLHKSISPAGLVRSLRGVIHGEAPLSRDLATLMIDALHGLEARDRTRERMAVLSSREREILSYVSSGARNRQIASALTISEFTVKRHMQNILGKLGVPSRRAAGDFYRHAATELVSAGPQQPA